MKFPTLFVTALCVIFLIGCNENSKTIVTKAIEAPIPPRVLSHEKYLAYTMVCADCNGSMQCDTTEQSVLSDEKGVFHFPENLKAELKQCPLIADVEMPISDTSNEMVKVKIASPAGCNQVTPLTSLMHHDMSLQQSAVEANEKFKREIITDMDACVDFLALKSNGTQEEKLEGEHLQEMAQHFMSSMQQIHNELNSIEGVKVTKKDKHHFAVHKYLSNIDIHTESINDKRYGKKTEVAPAQVNIASVSSADLSPSEINQQLAYLQALQNAKTLNVKEFFLGNDIRQEINTYADSEKNLVWVNNLNFTDSEIRQTLITQHRDYGQASPNVLPDKNISKQNGKFILSDFNNYYLKGDINLSQNPDSRELFTQLKNNHGMTFTNSSATNLQYVLTGKVAKVKGIDISAVFGLDGISSWHDAIISNGSILGRFLDQDDMEIYQLKETIYNPSILYPTQPEKKCSSLKPSGDQFPNLCNYLEIYHFTSGLNHLLQDRFIAKDVRIHANNDAEVADFLHIPDERGHNTAILYLSANNVHGPRPAYFWSKKDPTIGRDPAVGTDPAFFVGTAFPPAISPDTAGNFDNYRTSWSQKVIQGINVTSIIVPSDLQRKFSLPNKLHIAKIGDYYRFIDLREIGDVINRVGASRETHDVIIRGINKDKIKE
ncbi:hypothetical protein D5018_20745 [Parashewanella curva]|uniref:Uncharacterized protein n=1 Tax=Parashewanella curva TaxID=2338552 RepID=A0A3L8PQZ6_9GAMM|nr:hypothetical protein [Parashewanella curva]RLV57776.1 hypothetical protein D5018_20745 [Parashewanella curva]